MQGSGMTYNSSCNLRIDLYIHIMKSNLNLTLNGDNTFLSYSFYYVSYRPLHAELRIKAVVVCVCVFFCSYPYTGNVSGNMWRLHASFAHFDVSKDQFHVSCYTDVTDKIRNIRELAHNRIWLVIAIIDVVM